MERNVSSPRCLVGCLQLTHPGGQDHHVGLGLGGLLLEVAGLDQRSVHRGGKALGDALLLVSGPLLWVGHEPARGVHVHSAQHPAQPRRFLLYLGVELLDSLVVSHATLHAPLQAQWLNGAGIARLLLMELLSSINKMAGAEVTPVLATCYVRRANGSDDRRASLT